MTHHPDIVARAKREARLGGMAPSQVALVHDLCALIEAQAAEIAGLDKLAVDHAFMYAQAVHPPLLDVELEAALAAEGIGVYGPEAEKFERMFAAAMKCRAQLIESDAIASGVIEENENGRQDP